MAWSTEWNALMSDTVTVSSFSALSTDGYGVASYSTGTSYPARVVRTNELVRDFNGVEVVSNVTAWINTTGGIATDAKITLPDGSSPPILSIDTFPDEDGLHHTRVRF